MPSEGEHVQIRRRGFSLIELLIVIAIILILITAAIPYFQRGKESAYEAAAMQAIRTLHTAEVQYNSQYGRYATSLTELGPPENGERSASAGEVIGPDLATGTKEGYQFSVTGNGAGYAIHAEPVMFGTTGEHTYYSDETMFVRVNNGREPANAHSPVYGMEQKK